MRFLSREANRISREGSSLLLSDIEALKSKDMVDLNTFDIQLKTKLICDFFLPSICALHIGEAIINKSSQIFLFFSKGNLEYTEINSARVECSIHPYNVIPAARSHSLSLSLVRGIVRALDKMYEMKFLGLEDTI